MHSPNQEGVNLKFLTKIDSQRLFPEIALEALASVFIDDLDGPK